MGMNACEIFRDIDDLFANYETNKEQFNNEHGSYNKYCPGKSGSKRCDTDYEKLNSILGYAYTELIQNNMTDLDSENDPSADFLVMALSHRLCKLSKNHSLSIKDAFKKYLRSQGGFNYSSVLHNKKYFNGSNIGIINCFYLAFKQICETINTYGKSIVQQDEYIRVIAQCYIIYDRLYNFVNQCSPYFQLLNHLKAIYDEFKKAVIKLNDNDQTLRSMLKQIPPIDKTTFGSEFNTIGCTKTHKKLEQNISRIKTKPQDEQEGKDEFSTLTELLGSDDENGDLGNKDISTNSLNQNQNGQQGAPTVSKPASEKSPPTPPQASQQSGTNPQSETKDSDKGQGASKSEKTDSGTPKGNSDSEGGGSGSGTGSEKGGTKGGSGSPGSGTPSVQNDQGGSSGGPGSQGDSSNQGGSSGGPGSQGDSSNQGGSSGGPGSQGDSSNQGGAVGGSKESGDQAPSHSSGASNEDWLGNLGMSLNLTGYMPSVSGIYESSKNILTNTANQITSTYNSAKAIAQDTYDKTVSIAKDTYDSAVTAVKNTYDNTMTTIKGAYSATTNYIDGTVSSIINQLNSFSTFSQLNGDQSGSDGSGNSLPAGNSPLKAPQIPDPNLPQLPSSSTPSGTTTSPSPTSPDTIPTLSQSQSDPVQSHDTNSGTGVPKTLTNSSTDPSSTWNGSTIGTIVKINEKPSIWCIGSNKKCDILGIGIISISIFAFLTIMYKYISFGSEKNSKKKKSMKRVMKFVDGNRKTQIIIKSYDRNKDLKPIINSVDRKKDPTLNIYKLMQADPVPFINSFFLLIFFVYKKKFII
ncbi:PIR protein CIR protein [Plasmodium vinckei lentum]|uniref:PIR protein CIR protein n=1 Tax=Plasmodium vinckei lentum TaxID=138297 RepID=A0A6V7RSU0_PLAVN|nr:PIR protein CIR protein [Plasmodium vinckei lentum]